MTDEERKAWDEMVENIQNSREDCNPEGIIALSVNKELKRLQRVIVGYREERSADGNELTRLREENAALTKERDAGLALTHCAVCGSDTANTNESMMNVELTRLRAIAENEKRLLECLKREEERAEKAEGALRRIAGELGEFADADGETMVEKIRFLRGDWEKRSEELIRLVDGAADILAARGDKDTANGLRRRVGEEEVERIRGIEANEKELLKCLKREEGKVERLREAVKWAMRTFGNMVITERGRPVSTVSAELRRLAKEG